MRIINTLWLRNIKTFLRNKAGLFFSIFFPFFFLYIFKEIFVVEGINNPTNYMLAGIVITNVFQTSLEVSSSTIDDISTGYMKEILVSPIKPIYVAVGQILSATTIAVSQSIIVLTIGFIFGLRFTSVLTPIYVILVMIVVGLVFAGFGLLVATLIKNTKTFQIISMSIVMPMTFISGAYIPVNTLPVELRYVSYFNPMTYATAFFRTVILEQTSASTESLINQQLAFKIGSLTITPTIGFLVILIFGTIFLFLSTFVFTRIDFSKMNRSKAPEDNLFN